MNNLLFTKGDTVALVALSNPRSIKEKTRITDLVSKLENMGLSVTVSSYLYTKKTSEEIIKEKANEFNSFFAKNIKTIFDISGGDYGNSVLEYLDYKTILKSETIFFGYSDLTAIINTLYEKSNKYSYLYQVMNILDDNQEKLFTDTFFKNNNKLISHSNSTKTILGGNIRCFLKLAGTEYFPDITDKILLLEAMSGNLNRIETYFRQLKQMKIFENIDSIILGQFTELDKTQPELDLINILKKYTPTNIQITRNTDIGHSLDSKAIIIGKPHSII